MIFNGRYLKGAVKLIIKGQIPEKFINLCMAEEITLWSVTRQEEGLVAWISLTDFLKIRSLVRKSRTQVEVLSFFGLPFAVKRAKKRKMLMFGIIFFLSVLYILSSYIWFIEISGLKSLPDIKIRQIAVANGLKRASLKTNADIKKIEREILLNIPEISWVGINFSGTRAIIEVVEKTMPRQENKSPANIIAQKDGVIEEIIALSGQAAVKKGNTVKKGDLLIRGISPDLSEINTRQNSGVPVPIVPHEEIRAKGIVKARIWYESYAESERIKSIPTPTGEKQTAVSIKIGNKEFKVNSSPGIRFAEYQTTTIRKQINPWRNSHFNVEIIIDNHLEIITRREEISFEESKDQAKIKALSAVQENIPENAQILSRNFEIINTADYQQSNIVRVKVSVDTIEDIGETVDIKQVK